VRVFLLVEKRFFWENEGQLKKSLQVSRRKAALFGGDNEAVA
jgi:hypothetical protein